SAISKYKPENSLCYSVKIENSHENTFEKQELEQTDLDGEAGGDILVAAEQSDSNILIYYNSQQNVIEIV
ncbi:hypothetical protein JW868_03900, partial [Candidatus Woesearchaeota archaeon]|nr:hypothetical protein [Candidatus Woesearchaeota archaeon]